MRLNNKGFAISTVLYSLLVMATLILFLLVGNLSFERRTTSEFVNNIKDELNNYAKENDSGGSSGGTAGEPETDNRVKINFSYGDIYLRYINGDYVEYGDTFRIVTMANTSFSLSVKNNILSSSSEILINSFSHGIGQVFVIDKTSTDFYYYIHPRSNNYLVLGVSSSTLNEEVQLLSSNNSNGQKWTFEKYSNNNLYLIKSSYNNCMMTKGNVISINIPIVMQNCNSNLSGQAWGLIKS